MAARPISSRSIGAPTLAGQGRFALLAHQQGFFPARWEKGDIADVTGGSLSHQLTKQLSRRIAFLGDAGRKALVCRFVVFEILERPGSGLGGVLDAVVKFVREGHANDAQITFRA